MSPPRVYFLEAILGLFALCAVANQWVWSTGRAPAWWPYGVVATYLTLLTFSMVGYDLLFGDLWPPQTMLRNGTIVYYLVFLSVVALSYAPRMVVWAGAFAAISWGVGVYLIVRQPGTITSLEHAPGQWAEALLAEHLDPHFVDLDVVAQDIVVLLIVAGILAAGVWRARQMVLRQAESARERANLARYFSPRLVDALAQTDEPLGAVRTQPVAVLFADVVGFTRMSEHRSPEQVIALLRGLHERLEAAVFEHGGSLDKYLGDGVMATFGTPNVGKRDAADALACGRSMLARVADWNRSRAAANVPPVRLSIGIHYGEVVLGDVGSARRLEFAVIGDVANVASRLKALTREIGTSQLVSGAVIEAIQAAADADSADLIGQLRPTVPQPLRGRERPVAAWALRPEIG